MISPPTVLCWLGGMSSGSLQETVCGWKERLGGEEVLNHVLNVHVEKSQEVPS